jgi:hypothetical protein
MRSYIWDNTLYSVLAHVVIIFIEQDLIPKKDKGAYNHV